MNRSSECTDAPFGMEKSPRISDPHEPSPGEAARAIAGVAAPVESTQDDPYGLLAAAHRGDEDALARIIEKHGDDLLRVVRRRMPRRLRTMFDSQDFVQAFWATFFAHDIAAVQFKTPEDLRAYLCAVAANRVTDQVRKRLVRPGNNLNRETSMGPATADRPAQVDTPSQVAIASERLDDLLRNQPDHYRRIIELKAEGATNAEIAVTVGMNEGSVRRIIAKAAARAKV